MGIFSLGRKPRRFSHVPIFYDERDGRLTAVEQERDEAYDREALRGAFVQETSHLRRHREQAGSWTTNVGALFLLLLVLVLAFWFFMF